MNFNFDCSVSKCCSKFAEMAVEAVLKIVDVNSNFIDLERIKLDGKPGGSLENTTLIDGVVISQPLSHPHMLKVRIQSLYNSQQL